MSDRPPPPVDLTRGQNNISHRRPEKLGYQPSTVNW